MKIFFDTEFYDQGTRLDSETHLISIGLVTEYGRELYIENASCDHETPKVFSHDGGLWMKEHVLSRLTNSPGVLVRSEDMAQKIVEFIGDEKPEFWAYFGAYDWVLFCKLFYGLLNLPKGWPHLFRELKWFMEEHGVSKSSLGCPKQDPATQHHALHDAKWERDVYRWIKGRGTF